jgi:hypothetical protein
MTVFNFDGVSPAFGPVHLRLRSSVETAGKMEETANNTPGVLDVPPFTAVGTVDSFFDIFVELEIQGAVFHNGTEKRLSGIITHKPANHGDTYQSSLSTIQLLDDNENPTGFALKTVKYTPNPAIETDVFAYSECELQLNMDVYGLQTVQMAGDSAMRVFFDGPTEGTAQDDDGDGRDEVQVELFEMTLGGTNPTLGDVQLVLNGSYSPSLGEMEETANNTPGVLDVAPFTATGTVESFFDVYLEVLIGGQVYHNESPLRITEIIGHKPPVAGDIWESLGGVQLYDSGNNPTRHSVNAVAYEPAAVAPVCGDAGHPYPVGDFNLDCMVDFKDFAIFALHWLECTAPECD